ncbi:MAG: hypothetical protein ACOCUU_01165 [Nanoarchaeota archaeon]
MDYEKKEFEFPEKRFLSMVMNSGVSSDKEENFYVGNLILKRLRNKEVVPSLVGSFTGEMSDR